MVQRHNVSTKPKLVIHPLVEKGEPVAKNPWSMKVVMWSSISARLTEIGKEIGQH